MTKTAGEQLGRLLGEVLDVKSDYDGAAMGRCVRNRALVDVNKPLCRWTMVNTDGVASRIIFRYEKIIDLCFYCGRLNHLDKDCTNIPPSGKKYYGPWLRASHQDPIMMSEIAAELERLNAIKPDKPLTRSPRTPSSNNLELVPQHQLGGQKQKSKMKDLSSVPFKNLDGDSPHNGQIVEMGNEGSSKTPIEGNLSGKLPAQHQPNQLKPNN